MLDAHINAQNKNDKIISRILKNGKYSLIKKTIDLQRLEKQPILRIYLGSHIYGSNVIELSDIAENKTALIIASMLGDEQMAQMLINFGADVDIRDSMGCTALMWASLLDHENITKMLIKVNANINLKDIEGQTALDMNSEIYYN